jgi:outer membrane protein assembly factor BamE (lipoprotein component of BamABCDE complex)
MVSTNIQMDITRKSMLHFPINMIFLILFVLSLGGCATEVKMPLLEEKVVEVERVSVASAQKLKVGDSSAEVVKVLGSPNMLAKSKNGNESWVYDRVSEQYEMVQSSSDSSFIFNRQSQQKKSASSVKTFIVVVDFDSKGLVSSISYRFTQF